jgi:hypothetical protein
VQVQIGEKESKQKQVANIKDKVMTTYPWFSNFIGN